MHHPEAMLLVDDYQAELGEFDALLEQSMGTDHQVGISLRDMTADVALAIRLEGAAQQDDAITGAFENSPG